MSRQLLLNEIQRVFVENKEKAEDLEEEKYAFTKYPHLRFLFQRYRGKDEHWHQLLREIVVYRRTDLQYMYGRSMQLIRRFLKDTSLYFTVKTERGT